MAKNTPYIVVPNWNGEDMLKQCLDSLVAQSVKCRVVVVDNGSVDTSKDIIKSYKDIHLIELAENTGFTGGVNTGIEYAIQQDAEYVLLFNNDAVADKNWVKELVKALDSKPEFGIATCKFMRIDKKHLDSTGDFYTIWGLPYPRGRNEKDHGQYDNELNIFGASGGASVYRITMLKEIGLFDQDFFAYFEDVDISFRAQLAGWKVSYVPEAKAYHHVGGTSSKLGDFARFHSIKNFLLVYARNMPTKLYFKYAPLFTLQYLRLGVGSLIHGKPHVFLKGSWAAVKLHRSTVDKRRAVQKSRKVSVDYIDSILTHSRPPITGEVNE